MVVGGCVWVGVCVCVCYNHSFEIFILSCTSALNPYNGLKISAYKNTEELKSNDPASPYFDRELLFLQVYLEYIKDIKHFAKELKLSRWKEVLQSK